MRRRAVLGGALAAAAGPARAIEAMLPLPGGPQAREITTGFPGKGPMILQRSRPPLLETPFEVFDQGVFTPTDRFFVRWHWSVIPAEVDVTTFELGVTGHVATPRSLSLADVLALPRVELAAVNQCAGNSRGFFQPRVAGGEWANGAMGNARWVGARLTDVLGLAGVKPGAQRVRFAGLDEPVMEGAPKFMKSIGIDDALGGDILVAYAMNGAQLPILHGFPLRIVMPGWYSTYWVKMLNRIEVLDGPDDNFWTKTAYTIPDTPGADMAPGQAGVKMVPINRMVPRSFVTNYADGAAAKAGPGALVRGIAMGGSVGVRAVDVSTDGGASWAPAELGPDEGRYSFRAWQARLDLSPGEARVMVRCTNADGLAQPMAPTWNPSGYMRNVVETTRLRVA